MFPYNISDFKIEAATSLLCEFAPLYIFSTVENEIILEFDNTHKAHQMQKNRGDCISRKDMA
jgi:hypothetical protein